MSVQTYLDVLSRRLVLNGTENENIRTSINSLSKKVELYLPHPLHGHFQFGSSTRGTILPRVADPNSDVDYMIIFKNPNKYKPDTLFRYIREFVNKYYHRSEIYLDRPTIVLELKHIKFELVPAVQDDFGGLYIPTNKNSLSEWTATFPRDFDKKLTDANIRSNYLLKPLIRLLKYWNAKKLNYYYSSFLLERWIVEINLIWKQTNLKEYTYHCFESLNFGPHEPQRVKDQITRAKQIIQTCRYYERMGNTQLAEKEIGKLFPNF